MHSEVGIEQLASEITSSTYTHVKIHTNTVTTCAARLESNGLRQGVVVDTLLQLLARKQKMQDWCISCRCVCR